jgi:hypothetical protein
VTDTIDQVRREITERIEQLRPIITEYARLQAAAEALANLSPASPGNGEAPAAAAATTAAAAPRRRRAGRPRRATAAPSVRTTTTQRSADGSRRGRPKGSGTRAAEAVKSVEAQPGITIREIAAKMKIAPNYLYRVLPPLEEEGKIERRGKGWHPKKARG